MAVFKPLPRVIILIACGGLVELRVAEGHPEGPRPHQRFDLLQGGSCMEGVGGKGMAARVWRIRLRDGSHLARVGHSVLASANAQRDTMREGTRKAIRRLPWLGIPPLAPRFGAIGR